MDYTAEDIGKEREKLQSRFLAEVRQELDSASSELKRGFNAKLNRSFARLVPTPNDGGYELYQVGQTRLRVLPQSHTTSTEKRIK